ncbi:general transcriptional corepressor trfA-like isoform X2 [Mytilus californianus]|uniref:general transcriptional corepressor trfA-like isoform X2 n=1 Tax=Mytilus californianus TaxID=6549 RepID=UPI0022481890|nr:general transcriptional corepressor trfA-like isoform X2 [Mytilus californianus]
MGNCKGKNSKESKSQMRGEAYRPTSSKPDTMQGQETGNVGDKLDNKNGNKEDAVVTNDKLPFVNSETLTKSETVLQGTSTNKSVSDTNGLKANDHMGKQDKKQLESDAIPEKPVEKPNKDVLSTENIKNNREEMNLNEVPTGISLKVPGSKSDDAEIDKPYLFSKGVPGEEPQTEDSGFTYKITGVKDPAPTDQSSSSHETVPTEKAIDEDKSSTTEDDKLQPENTSSDKLQPKNTPSDKSQPENAPSDNQQNNNDSTGYNRSKFSNPGDEQDKKMSKEMKEIDGKKKKKKKKKPDKYDPPPNANIQNYYGNVDVLNLGNGNVYMGKKEKEEEKVFSKGVPGGEPQTEDLGFTNKLTGIKDPASTDQISRSNEIVPTDNTIDEDKSLTKEVDNVPTEKASGNVSEPIVENRSNQSNELKNDSTEKPSDQFQPGNTPSYKLQPGNYPSDKLQPGNYPSDKLQPGNTPSDKLQSGNTPSDKLKPENAPSDNQQNNDDSTGYNSSKFSNPGDEQDEKMSKEMKEIDGKKRKKKKKKRDKYEPPPNANIQNYYGYVDVLNLGNDNVYMGKKEKEEEKDPIRPTTTCSLETMKVLTEVAKSVGYITGRIESGTCWRVGNDKIITAAHVVLGNINNTEDKTSNEKLLKTFDVDFDYISEKSQSFFKVEPRVLFMDESLDVAVLQLIPDDRKPFPPPLKKFYRLNPKKDEDKHIYLISHNKGIKKEVNSGIGIWNPTEKRMEDLERFCQKYGQQNGYIELDRKDRLVIQCEFVGGASGSPGIVIFNNVAHVVFVYIRGFPSFYYSKKFTGEQKRKYPSEKLLQQGVNIGDLFNTMSKKAVNLTLRNEIFPVEAKLEQTINQHQLAITGDKTSSNTNKTETPIDIVKGKMDNISSKSELKIIPISKGIVCTDQSENKIPDAASYKRLTSHVSVHGQTCMSSPEEDT